MPPTVAVLDADVLVPIVACDLLLTAFDLELFEPIVSSEILEEVENTLIEDFPHLDPDAVRRRVGHMRTALADQTVDPAPIDEVPEVINVKDRHVVAAAMIGGADMLVTNDAALRAEVAQTELSVEPVDGDSFATRLYERSPEEVDGVIDALIAKRRIRPVSKDEMVDQLRPHFPTLAERYS